MAFELQAEIRREENPRALRRRGQVPGIVYGPGSHELLAFDRKTLERLLAQITRSSRILLKIDGMEMPAFLKEIQYHSLTDEVLHVDLYHPPADRPITLEVPVHLHGEAMGRKSGGIVSQFREEVEIHGPSEMIPERIELDISELDIHDSLHASDISLPEGVELLTPPEALIVTVLAPRKVEEVLAAETIEIAEEEEAVAEEAEGEAAERIEGGEGEAVEEED